MLRITFYGGFHNREEMEIRVKDKKSIERIVKGESHPLDEISDNQRKKLDRHFCGIKGCTCGGALRAYYYCI